MKIELQEKSIWIADNTYLLLIIGIRNYTLKLPLLAHSYGEPHVTQVTFSPGDALPFSPSSKFRRRSYATAFAGEKRSPIIGTLRYNVFVGSMRVSIYLVIFTAHNGSREALNFP